MFLTLITNYVPTECEPIAAGFPYRNVFPTFFYVERENSVLFRFKEHGKSYNENSKFLLYDKLGNAKISLSPFTKSSSMFLSTSLTTY